jgi:type IV fimbrial biogenesis protein FimT
MPNRPAPRRLAPNQTGLTLVECALTAAVVAVIVGLSLPSFQSLTQRRAVEGLAAQLETDLQLARSAAVAHNESVRVSFQTAATGACYVVHTGPAHACVCQPSGDAVCDPGAMALRTSLQVPQRGISLTSNSASMLFDSAIGTVSPTGTIRVIAPQASLHLVVNIMGRVRTCTPDRSLPGYADC